MNISYLMQYISQQLHTIVRRYDLSRVLKEEVCARKDFQDIPSGISGTDCPDPVEALLSEYHTQYPRIFTGSFHVAYSAVGTEESIFVTGPLILNDNTQSRYRLPHSEYTPQWLLSVYRCTISELVKMSLLIYNLFHEKTLTSDETVSANCLKESDRHQILQNFSDIMFDRMEASSMHNPYDQEKREIMSIKNGDMERLKMSWAEDYLGKTGILAKNKLRHSQNMAIVLITLGSRAAIEGGLHPEIAYSLSDSYIQKVEETVNPDTAIQLGRQAEYQYAALVNELKLHKPSLTGPENPHIAKCKDYIFAHLHEKIRIQDIAEELFLNANYLSDLFKKKEGVTIAEYIKEEKLNLARNMLIYSGYSYNEIAVYLGFCSQSHLGRQFREATGMTLRQYREAYGVRKL